MADCMIISTQGVLDLGHGFPSSLGNTRFKVRSWVISYVAILGAERTYSMISGCFPGPCGTAYDIARLDIPPYAHPINLYIPSVVLF